MTTDDDDDKRLIMASFDEAKVAQLLAQLKTGFQQLNLAPEQTEVALVNLKDWLADDKFKGLISPSDYRGLLEQLIQAGRWDLLVDSFRQLIPFGTGGRRGNVGFGPNRLNPYTVATSIYGHVDYLRQKHPNKTQLAVVLAYDVRAFHDLKAVYPTQVTNPLLRLSSKDLAELALAIYTAAGLVVYHLPDDSSDYLSTPELSFLVRHFKAEAGLNISASHNHPDDNGSKFYDQHGALEIAPADQQLTKMIEAIKDLPAATVKAQASLVKPINPQDRQAFIDVNLSLRLKPAIGSAKFVFTGLHGTGVATVGRCLEAMGYLDADQLVYVEKQCQSRSDFKHVKYCNPNPESPDSLDMGIDHAEQFGADLLMATDPDADRLGGAARDGDNYRFLSGNDLAVILTRYRLQSLKQAAKLPPRPLVIKTLVTSELVAKIAADYQAQVIGDLPVGFKYIGDVLNQLEANGRFGKHRAKLADFIIGVENSHGFLLTSEIRDKDAAGAAVVLAELTDQLVANKQTIVDYLFETYQRYGYHADLLRRIVLPGAGGSAQIAKIQAQLRRQPPKALAGRAIKQVIDYHDQQRFGPFLSETDQAARNMLVYQLEDDLRVVIRPSGTEPQIKICFESATAPEQLPKPLAQLRAACQKADQALSHFSSKLIAEILSLIEIDLPAHGVAIADSVPLSLKLAFCQQFLPEFEKRAAAKSANLADWAQSSLKNVYKQTTKEPFEQAVETYLKDKPASPLKRTLAKVWHDLT